MPVTLSVSAAALGAGHRLLTEQRSTRSDFRCIPARRLFHRGLGNGRGAVRTGLLSVTGALVGGGFLSLESSALCGGLRLCCFRSSAITSAIAGQSWRDQRLVPQTGYGLSPIDFFDYVCTMPTMTSGRMSVTAW